MKMIMVVCLLLETILCLVMLLHLKRKQKVMDFLLAEQKRTGRKTVPWKEADEEQLRMIRKRMEYTALQSQINPHFLYNTLESIRSRALLDGNEEIAAMTEILSRFFRYCISNGERLIKIREEINHIRNYYYIQKYRFEERMEMDIIVEAEELNDLYIPKMSLQPLVENAMVHGLESIADNGRIVIRINSTKQKVVIIVEDNGAGMSLEKQERLNEKLQSQLMDASSQKGPGNGIALTNINARIRISLGNGYGIHYRSAKGRGTQAVLTLPRIDEFARVKYGDILQIEE